jgi:hypothetical protein
MAPACPRSSVLSAQPACAACAGQLCEPELQGLEQQRRATRRPCCGTQLRQGRPPTCARGSVSSEVAHRRLGERAGSSVRPRRARGGPAACACGRTPRPGPVTSHDRGAAGRADGRARQDARRQGQAEHDRGGGALFAQN